MVLAPIELLPPELIQPIFFLSGANLALVDASHHIAAKLSVDYVYHEICVHYLTQNLFSRAEQSSAQSRIFRTKWMTWSFFKSFVLKTYGPKGCLCGQTPEEGCFDAQWPPNFANATTMLFTRSHLPKLSFVKCRLPFRLLHGPWTKDKIEFLRFLLWTTSMTVDWSDSYVRQKAGEGKKDAIIERNLEAVEIFNHNRRLGKAPGMSTVRFAVMEAGCDRSIVFDIMATARAWGLRGESWNCSELDEWCEKGIREGSPKAQWLQIKLKELRTTYSTGYLIRDNAAGNSNSLFGYMDAKSGDYDGGPDDKLVINRHQWNELARGVKSAAKTLLDQVYHIQLRM